MLGLLYPVKAMSVTKSRQVYFVTFGLGSGKHVVGAAHIICVSDE